VYIIEMVRSESLKRAQQNYRLRHPEETRERSRKEAAIYYQRHKEEISARRRERNKLRKASVLQN